MALKPGPEWDDMTNLMMAIQRIVAMCPETRARLRASSGRRKAGRPRRYAVDLPNGTFSTNHLAASVSPDNPKGLTQIENYSMAFGLTAFSDDEAIDKANEKLSTRSVMATVS